mmetsp:Transcript_263/g.415  ORF Transcript_263/g.415 Transcript_263/m.415 type:complete len:244 (+) Transcript_263:85-816(+)
MKTDRTINENNMQHESPDVKKPTSKPREIQDGSRIEDCDSESQSSVESSSKDAITLNKAESPVEADGRNFSSGEKEVVSKQNSIDDSKNREKRLAMNRVSARERRKRKRVLIENLQTSVVELTRENNAIRKMNQDLRSELEHFARALTSGLEAQRSIPFGETTPLLSQLARLHPVQQLTERQILLSLQQQQQQQLNQRTNLTTLGFGGATHLDAALLEGAQELRMNENTASNARTKLDGKKTS